MSSVASRALYVLFCVATHRLFTDNAKLYLPAFDAAPPRLLTGHDELEKYCKSVLHKYEELQSVVVRHHPVLYQDLER